MFRRSIIQYLLQQTQLKSSIFYLQNKLHLRPRSLCLIVACARSGSTAIANWLSHQSGVVYAKQSRIIPVTCRYIQDIDEFKNLHSNRDLLLKLGRELVWKYYSNNFFLWNRNLIDKENFDSTVFSNSKYEQFLNIVQELFPHIKILYLVRDPVATIWSMQKKNYLRFQLFDGRAINFTYFLKIYSTKRKNTSDQLLANVFFHPFGIRLQQQLL